MIDPSTGWFEIVLYDDKQAAIIAKPSIANMVM